MPGGGDAIDNGADLPWQRRGRCGQGRPFTACSRAPFEEQAVSTYLVFLVKPKLFLFFLQFIVLVVAGASR